MYFVQYNPLKEKLRRQSLNDRDTLPYLILNGVVVALMGLNISSDGLNAFNVVSTFISVAIIIGGTFHVYDQNGGKEGFDLVRKYIVLGWVVAIRVFLASIPVFLILGVLIGLGNLDDAFSDFLIMCCGAAFKFIYYQRLGKHVRNTTAVETDNGDQHILP